MKDFFYTVTGQDEGLTVERLLKKLGFTGKEISRQKFIPRGISLDGVQCRVTKTVCEGQKLKLVFESEKQACRNQPELKKQDLPKILYEDEDLLVVNKPGGLSSHRGRGHYLDNLGTRIQCMLASKGKCDSIVREIGRLDRDTSGLMIFAKNRISAARLSRQRQEVRLEKTYYALIWGSFLQKTGEICFPLKEADGVKNRMTVSKQGKEAVTCYQAVHTGVLCGKEISLVRCSLKTGRTHQIRVHMAASGHSVVGDSFYGTVSEDEKFSLCLHAGSIRFLQPFTGKEICVTVRPDSWPLEWEEETWQNG